MLFYSDSSTYPKNLLLFPGETDKNQAIPQFASVTYVSIPPS